MAEADFSPRPSLTMAMLRGFRERCPRCGKGAIFRAFLKVGDQCSHCDEHLGDIRADDLPAYLTILVVGHIVVPGLLWAERYDFSTLTELAVAVPLSLGLIALLLPRFKGAAVGLLWSLNRQKKAAA
jgi:uncharacterized protein (DUF983 family)